MRRVHFFNMIEILLAIAVIAIGLSSVMGLFATGLRIGNAAVAGSDLPNVTESILAAVRKSAAVYASESGWGTFDTNFSVLNSSGWTGESGVSLDTFGNLSANGDTVVGIYNGGARALLYRQLVPSAFDAGGSPTAYEAVFSAIAEVRRIASPDDIVISNPQDPGGTGLTTKTGSTVNFPDAGGNDSQGACRRVVEVRISYPADLPHTAREAKIYRLELFNDKYDRSNP